MPRLYVRFQTAHPDRWGRFPGVFALVDGLSAAGRLTVAQERFRRVGNEWLTTHLVNPYAPHRQSDGRRLHPRASAWFTSTAADAIDRVGGYLDILDEHGIAWARLDTDTPGVIVYDDPRQVLAVPDGSNAADRR
ncbi:MULTISPECIES: hypothetical protein [unclassified Nocardia]|uniref:hypothetical protein n=1 Tax=unclassified Nocardia TaxID=2637762 RepID=UPI0036B6AFD2